MDDGARPGFISRLFRSRREETVEDEIASILSEGQDQGIIRDSEAEMITNIFELDDIEASEIMTHRKNIIALSSDSTLDEAISFFCSEGFSRFPVYEENIDNITGILHIKDALRFYMDENNREKEISQIPDLYRKAGFIPETSKIDTVFRNMQAENSHMVIVVDEYGQTAGLLAMEDILERIVGQIFDEHDEVEYNVVKTSDNTFEARGLTPLDEMEQVTGIEFDDDDNDTLNGYLISKLDRIPEKDLIGETVNDGNVVYEILQVEERTIAKVRLEIKENAGVTED